MANNLILGSYLSLSKPDYLLGAVKEMLAQGADTLMIYSGSPTTYSRSPVSSFKISETHDFCLSHHIDETKFVMHAPYLINLADPSNQLGMNRSKEFLLSELSRCSEMGISLLVLHPGSAVHGTSEEGIEALVSSLNDVFEIDHSNVIIAIESMAGKGHEIGRNMDELGAIYRGVNNKERIGFCLDSCHLWDSGVDLRNPELYFKELSQFIPLDKIKVLHLNDSKNVMGAHIDRHANLGHGMIGFDTLLSFATNLVFKGLPIILETPYLPSGPPYAEEIIMLRTGIYKDIVNE